MRKDYIYAGIGIAAVAVALLIVFVIGLPGGNATITSVESSPTYAQPGESKALCVNIKNNRPVTTDYLVEMGTIPTDVAQNWFPSTFALFGQSSTGQCCSGQQNIHDRTVSLGPLEEKKICVDVTAPWDGIQDRCGNTQYWVGKGNHYSNYFMVANKCHYRNGVEQEGFDLYDVETRPIQVGEESNWWDLIPLF